MASIAIEHVKTISPDLFEELFRLEEKCFHGRFQYTFGPDARDYFLHPFAANARERGDLLVISRNTSSRITGVLLLETYTKEKFEEIFHPSHDEALKFEDPFWYIDTMFVDPESSGIPFLLLLETFFEILCLRSTPRIDLIRFHARTHDPRGGGALTDILVKHYDIRPLRVIENYLQSGEAFAYFEVPVQALVVHALWREKKRLEVILSNTKSWREAFDCFLQWIEPDHIRLSSLKLAAPSAATITSTAYLRTIIQCAWMHEKIGSFILTETLDEIFGNIKKLPEGFIRLLCDLHHYRLEALPPAKALAEARKFRQISLKSSRQTFRVLACQNMAIAWMRNNNLKKAARWQQAACEGLGATKDRFLEAHCHYYLAELLFAEGSYPEAKSVVQTVLQWMDDKTRQASHRAKKPCDSYRSKDRSVLLGRAHLLMANIHAANDRPAAARSQLEKALGFLRKHGGFFRTGAMESVVTCYLKIDACAEALQLIEDCEDEMPAVDSGAELLPGAARQWLAKCRTQTAEMKQNLILQGGSKERRYAQTPVIGKYDARM